MNKLKQQIFVSVSTVLAGKWPCNTTKDHEDIADTALKLTNTLHDKFTKEVKQDKPLKLLKEG